MKVAEQKRLEKRREVTRREERLREQKLREEKRREEKRREEIRGKEREGDRSRAKQRKDDPSKGEERRGEEKRGEERAVKQMSFPFHFAEGPPNRFFRFCLPSSLSLSPPPFFPIFPRLDPYYYNKYSCVFLRPFFHSPTLPSFPHSFYFPISTLFQQFLTFLTFSSLLELRLKKFYWRDREQRNT